MSKRREAEKALLEVGLSTKEGHQQAQSLIVDLLFLPSNTRCIYFSLFRSRDFSTYRTGVSWFC